MSILGDLQLIVIAILGAIASGAAAYFVGGWRGRKAANDKHEAEELNEYVETRKRMDDEINHPDSIPHREWLRQRAKRKP